MANVSHGRGGAANIRPDDTPYADGGIIREGAIGDQGDGQYSSGRGGTGNIGGNVAPPGTAGAPHDAEIVPDLATRLSREESHHVGRGGAGNTAHVHHDKDKEGHHENLFDKVKHLVTGKKEGEA